MHTLTEKPLDTETARTVSTFLERVARDFSVRGAFLFGSRARGQFSADSDADVAVLLTGEPGKFLAAKLAMADIAFDVLLETGIRVQPLPVWETEWLHPNAYANPDLLNNIEREGIRLQ